MDELNKAQLLIRVKRKKVPLVEEKLDEIRNVFSVCLIKLSPRETSNPRFLWFIVEPDRRREDITEEHLVAKVQNFVDTLCEGELEGEDGEGEDSSYDSDQESEGPHHQDVSRTASDTLGAEFAEYVSLPPQGYLAKVEFGLKLGYTERHVQAALQKLGPNPGQNDLLAELIKLGAQTPTRLGSESSVEGVDETELELLTSADESYRLRPVVVDGSNVAMSHGNKVVFSCRGIKICVDWFRSRGHKEITVFVPLWRKESSRPDNPITDQEILNELEREKILVFTPSRHCNGKRIQCYDDRYILKLAAEMDGIVVSNDNYRDLIPENPEYRKVIEERLLMYSFVNDRFMPPDDPLGRSGPTLDRFLRIQPRRGDPPPPCPYGKKCTYGNKCKFHHPERGPLPHKSVTERLAENAQRHLQARGRDASPGNQLKGKSLSLPLQSSEGTMKAPLKKTPLARTKSTISSDIASSLPGKSQSVDNIDGSCFRTPPPSYATPPPPLWGPKPWPDESENLHRKLQRQLTLNPSCDPRLYHIQRQHQAVTRVMSCEPPAYSSPSHQHVTRIASAPPAHPPVQICSRPLSSASDPQLNLSTPPPALPSWPIPPPPTTPHPPSFHPLYSGDEGRQRLVYHLASIFPEEQVQTALRYYPNETNPQKICAAILNLFPPKP